MRKGLFSAALLLAGLLAACGSSAPTGTTSATSDTGTSATSSSGTMATSDTSMMSTSTAMATDTSMMSTSTAMATDTSMMGTSTAMATDTSMMGTSTAMATDTSMMGTSTSSTATSTSMMTGTMTAGSGDILSIAGADPRFSTLVAALKASGLDQQLASAGPITIFAPTDDAFAALPAATLTALLADPTKLAKILSYHVVQGNMTSAQVSAATTIPTLEGENLAVSATGGTVTLNNSAKVTVTGLSASNGVIYVIDKVLVPPTVTLQ